MYYYKLGDQNPQIEIIQSVLKRLKLYDGKINGIFDKQTQEAVKKFQKQFGLTPDGIVGPDTFDKLFPYVNGYYLYRVQPNDTFYSVAQRFGTSVNSIIFANPTVDPHNLQIGKIIVIPIGDIIFTDVRYTSSLMNANLGALGAVYPFLETGILGKSVLNIDIPYVRIGVGKKEVFYSASIHGNEWITSVLLMNFIEDYCKSIVNNQPLYGYDPMEIYNNVSIYIAPMVNPDGVDLVTGFIQPGNEIYIAAKKASDRYPTIPFPSGWKANARGVDLDLQFPYKWEEAKKINYANGFTSPGPTNFVGYGPLTEPESLAIYNFTLLHDFKLILSYHTQGNLIYWNQDNPSGSEAIASQLANVSGYTLEAISKELSYATYMNWFIQNYNKPGYIVKVGSGPNPISLSQFDSIYEQNIGLLVYASLLA